MTFRDYVTFIYQHLSPLIAVHVSLQVRRQLSMHSPANSSRPLLLSWNLSRHLKLVYGISQNQSGCRKKQPLQSMNVVVRKKTGKWTTSRQITFHIVAKIINKSRQNYHRHKLSSCCDAGKRWKVAKELLHSSDWDYSRNEAENHTLCNTFTLFAIKIQTIKTNIKAKLSIISPLSNIHEAIFSGQLLSTIIPVSCRSR